jgi:hypothetical protein
VTRRSLPARYVTALTGAEDDTSVYVIDDRHRTYPLWRRYLAGLLGVPLGTPLRLRASPAPEEPSATGGEDPIAAPAAPPSTSAADAVTAIADVIDVFATDVTARPPERRLRARLAVQPAMFSSLHDVITALRGAETLRDLLTAAHRDRPTMDVAELRRAAEAMAHALSNVADHGAPRVERSYTDAADVRRGLAVSPVVVDVPHLCGRVQSIMQSLLPRVFDEFLSLGAQLSGNPTVDVGIRDLADRLLAIADRAREVSSLDHKTPSPRDDETSLGHRLAELLATITTALTDFTGADLHDVDLTDIPLDGVRWSTTTTWGVDWQTYVMNMSKRIDVDLYEIDTRGKRSLRTAEPAQR